jgi:hypothetical protein
VVRIAGAGIHSQGCSIVCQSYLAASKLEDIKARFDMMLAE